VATTKLALSVTAWSIVVGAAVAGLVGMTVQAPPATAVVPVPTFTAAATTAPGASQPTERSTLLPSDCTEILPGPVDVAALLAQPVGSYQGQTVVGVGSPSVGMLEQLTCSYQRLNQNTPALVVRLGAFTDPDAAARQRDRNLAAEAGETIAAGPEAVGQARGALLTQPAHHQLFVACERYTITLSLARGTVPDREAELVLTDLTRRIWPNLSPQPPPIRPAGRR
jgi:hypothetical protein